MISSNVTIAILLFGAMAALAEVKPIEPREQDDGSMTVTLPGQSGAIIGFSPEGGALFRKRMAHYEKYGYMNRTDQPSKIDTLLGHIKAATEQSDFFGRGLKVKALARELEVDGGGFDPPFVFTPLQSAYKTPDSGGYVFLDGGRVGQLQTDTRFGTLLMEEFKGSGTAYIRDPNVTLSGSPGKLSHVRYQGGKWATVLYAASDKKMILIECDEKLEGEKVALFLRLGEFPLST